MGKLEKSFYWLFLTFVIYITIGFKLVPAVLKDKLTTYLNENLTQNYYIEKIEFNPFTFNLKIHNFSLYDENNISDFSFKTLEIEVSPIKFIEKGYLHLDNIVIDALFLNIKEDKNGSFNISNYLKPKEQEEEKSEAKESSNIEFLVSKLELLNSNINFEKQRDKTPYKLNLKDINYTIYDFGTYKNILSSNNLNFFINEKTNFNLVGAFRLTPFLMYGKISINDLKIKDLAEYKNELFNFEINNNANLNLETGFNIQTKDGFNLKFESELLELKDVQLKQNSKNIASLKELKIGKFIFDLSQKLIELKETKLNSFDIKAILNKNGVNLANLIKTQKSEKTKEETKTKPWEIKLSNIAINGDFSFENSINKDKIEGKNSLLTIKNIINKGLETKIESISLKNKSLKNIFYEFNQTLNSKDLKVDINSLSLKKDVLNIPKIAILEDDLQFLDENTNKTIKVAKLKTTINNLSLKNSDIQIKNIDSKIAKINFFDYKEKLELEVLNNLVFLKDFRFDKKGLYLQNFRVEKTAININDKINSVKINGDNINIDLENIQGKNSIFNIKKIDITKPNFSVILDKKVVKKEEKTSTNTPQKRVKKDSIKINIGPTTINEGAVTFEDKNLPIPFVADITQLNGNISHIKSSKSSLATLSVNGVVNKYGTAQITGSLNPNNIKFLTDVSMIFKNISMKNFTPYSGKFLGRELKRGKLDLDLKYNIDKSNIDATNKIVITKLELGEKIKSDEAISLPLDIAIALLKDSKGVINIEIPVLGNVDDPQFSVSSIVWKAFSNLITKTVTAPFSVLGAMFNFKEEQIKTVKFEENQSAITPIQKETLDRIAKILNAKENFAIKINPSYIEKKENEKIGKTRVLNIKKYLLEEKKINKNQLILDEKEIKNSSSNIELKLEEIK